MNKFRITTLLLFLWAVRSVAQVGGSTTYSFLDLTAAARTAALGGTFISVKDNDLNLALQNPSLLNPTMDGEIALGAVSYVSDIKYGDAAFALDRKNVGTFMAFIHYIDYGTFTETDNTAAILGNFRSSEYSVGVGWAHPISSDSSFTVGAAAKFIISQLYLNN